MSRLRRAHVTLQIETEFEFIPGTEKYFSCSAEKRHERATCSKTFFFPFPAFSPRAAYFPFQRCYLLPSRSALKYIRQYSSNTPLTEWKTVYGSCLEMLLCAPGIDPFLMKAFFPSRTRGRGGEVCFNRSAFAKSLSAKTCLFAVESWCSKPLMEHCRL